MKLLLLHSSFIKDAVAKKGTLCYNVDRGNDKKLTIILKT